METKEILIKELLEEVKELNKEQYKRFLIFMNKYVICVKTFGEEYCNELKPYIKTEDCDKIEEITNGYIARLSTDGAGILIDGVKVN